MPVGRAWVSAVLGVALSHAALGATGCSPDISTLRTETSGYQRQFVTVGNQVRLEVLDWGGHGRPLVLLSGLGNTAHVFDSIAPVLSTLDRKFGDVFGDHQAALASPERGVLSLSMRRRRSRRVNRH